MLAGAAAYGQGSSVYIESSKSIDTRIPIVVPPFTMDDPSLAAVAQDMTDAIVGDLSFSGLFRILPRTSYPSTFTGLNPDASHVNLDEWAATKAEHLVYGKVLRQGGRIIGQYRLFDLYGKEQIVGKQIAGKPERARMMAHSFSEELIRYAGHRHHRDLLQRGRVGKQRDLRGGLRRREHAPTHTARLDFDQPAA